MILSTDPKDLKRGRTAVFRIDDIAFGGKGISRLKTPDGDYIVFVTNTIPGQTVRARVMKKRKNFAEAKPVEVIERSEQETTIPYQPIPGAPFATWPVEKQQAHKKQSTIDLLTRIGKIADAGSLFDEFISSPRTWHYRNKMEYSFSSIVWDETAKKDIDAFGLGFKHRGQWRIVDNLEKDSGLFDKGVENNLKHIRQYCQNTGLPPWHPVRHEGFFRTLTVRKSFAENRLVFKLTTTSEGLDSFDATDFVKMLKDLFGSRLAGVVHAINNNKGDRNAAAGTEQETLYGKSWVEEHILNLRFKVDINSFFQPNPASAALLYTKAIDYAFENIRPEKNDTLLDLFCGTGTIGQLLASRNPSINITGVDIVESAIEDARNNAALNGLKNLTFFAEDIRTFLHNHPQFKGKIKVVLLDPPRSGITPRALKRIIELDAKRIVYISCNPATQARDLIELADAGYRVKKFSIVDQFPHTAHIETVVLLEKL